MIPRTRSVISAIFGLLVFLGLAYLLKVKGTAQLGNIVSFAGSLILSIPPIKQALTNKDFHSALRPLKKANISSELGGLVPDVEGAQAKAFITFSWWDLICLIVGTVVLAVGLLLQVFFGK